MKLSFAFLPSLVILCACHTPPKEKDKESEESIENLASATTQIPQITIDVPDHQFEFASLQLNQRIEEIDMAPFKHYGEFYTDDFTIYRLDRIDYLAESYYIEDINLYFIDSLLVKIQAFLREDRTNDFLKKYGKAKIAINNYHNKKLLESESVIEKVNGKIRINDEIDYYKLKWDRKDIDIEYTVNKQADSTASKVTRLLDDKNQRYKLTFQTKDFDYQMAWVKWEAYKEGRGLKVEGED